MTRLASFMLSMGLFIAIFTLLTILYHFSYSYSLSLTRQLKAGLNMNYLATLSNSVVALLSAIFYLFLLGLMLLLIIELVMFYCRIAN